MASFHPLIAYLECGGSTPLLMLSSYFTLINSSFIVLRMSLSVS